MAFFKQFPKVPYDLYRDGVKLNITDLYRSVSPLASTLDNAITYKFYEIKNGERPDIVSQRLYGTPDYYWTFFIVNDFLHDGLAAWPMSQEELLEYQNTEYNGWVINTRPEIIRDTNGIIIDTRNSLAGRFEVGEEVVGSISGTRGTVTKKIMDLNQLVIQNVTGPGFIGDPDNINNQSELIIGQTSTDSVSTWESFTYREAPHFYYRTDDPTRRLVDNGVFIQGGEPASDLSFMTNREYLFRLNEKRSNIKVVDPNYIEQFIDLYEEALNA